VNSVGNVSLEPIQELSFSNNVKQDYYQNSWNKWWKFLNTVKRDQVDSNTVRCPDADMAEKMTQRIILAKDNHDSIGGTVVCVIRNLPTGLGEPCFDKMEALLAHAMLSIPATKGFEIGSGFYGTDIPGHIHNDAFVLKPNGKLGTTTNFSGGIQGGITNGEPVYFKVAFKPPATIGQAQSTATYQGRDGTLEAKGRHDPCVLPRAVPIVEAMAALVVMETVMHQNARRETAKVLDPTVIPAILKGELNQ
jgi:chorismate synthase